ncbi:receptor-interacting serine/threonine-protein kinase 3-like [Ctenopharyngodon idella]|uniref:receptor-interacting serine/threonine-protein kinase 3-like n=1 Tax=Ctenopharyngodon idella TaxID=7959 RepID=UPI00222E5EE6|nr:receptor-interacting serine/threonine-protein kinase 3-like [Ctenopharyngodon idella]
MAGQVCFPPLVIRDDSLKCFVKIGAGGFGQIYRAKHTKWGMDVAIKLLLYKDGSTSSIHREANLMFQGGNPNVIRIFGLYEGRVGEPQLPLQSGLVMELMPKGSVAGLLQTLAAPPPWPLAFRMAHQIGLGMNFLHHLTPPLLHLDLKPSNVLLNDSLDAKITDFGLSRVARSVSKCAREKDEDEGGTLSYMPPEALQSINYKASKASDVYSYGVLLWSIITGKEPYDGVVSSLVRFRIPLGDRPDVTLIDCGQTEGLEDLLNLMKRCWDQDANKRPTFLNCVNATEKIFELHQRELSDAVRDVLKQLEGDICSSLKSVHISRKPQNEVRPVLSCVTGSLPKQETAAGYTNTVKKEPSPRLAAVTPPRTTQRQTSTPGGFHINMSNVVGVQFGNNNSMNIVQKSRQRHRTAPSRVNTSENAQKKP